MKYKNDNTTFILWLYDNDEYREEYLHDWKVTELITAETLDSHNHRIKGRSNMRLVCKVALDNTNKTDKNCPIILRKITFNLFSHYLTTRRNKSGGYLSKASYSGIRSAFVHLYRMGGEKMGPEFQTELSQFMSGMKRTVAKEKAESGTSLDEGKKSMSYEAYKKLCELLYEGEGDDYSFAHTFLTLEWNLLARSDNCLSMNVNHIQWANDALLFYFGKTKGDQLGDRAGDPWHVYANPKNPPLCPILALSNYLLSHPDLLNGNNLLFVGNNQYDRFIKYSQR